MSTREVGLTPHLRALIAVASLVLAVLGIRLAAPVLVPFALATLVTLASLPALLRLLRAGVPRSLAVTVLVVLDSAMLAFVGWIIALSAAEVAEALPRYLARIDALKSQLFGWLQEAGIEVGRLPDANLIQPGRWLEIAASAMYELTNLLSSLLLVLLFLVFMLSEVAGLPDKLRTALGNRAVNLHRFAPVVTEVQEYLALKTLISLATGVLIGGSTYLLGLDFALFWGLLAFLLNYIPNIGSIIAALPAVLVALLQLGPGSALVVLGVYLAVNMVLGNLLEPIVMGRRLGLSTLVIMMALVFWGWVWGVAGMFLAVPLTMAVKIVLEGTDRYRWISVLMGPGPQHGSIPLSQAARALHHPPSPISLMGEAVRPHSRGGAQHPAEHHPSDAQSQASVQCTELLARCIGANLPDIGVQDPPADSASPVDNLMQAIEERVRAPVEAAHRGPSRSRPARAMPRVPRG